MSQFGLEFMYLFAAHRADAAAIPRRRRTIRRNRRMVANVFALSEAEFKKNYRLSKSLTKQLIEDLKPIIRERRRRDSLNVTCKVLISLAFYASGSYQHLIGQNVHHFVSQPSVSRAVKQVTDALNDPRIFGKYVKFPNSTQAREKVKREFLSAFGIPGVIGCLDGTHIGIVKPSQREEAFYCRKGYHSLNVMIICDAALNILCVDPSNPGSSHDSTVWRNHPLNRYLYLLNQAGETNFLLGDSGYPLRENLMTPILNAAEGTPEALYYDMHVKARNVVERTIGVLKARFRCLLVARKLHYKPEKAAKIVNACCVLHNLANGSQLEESNLSPRELDYERRQQLQLRHVEATLARAVSSAAESAPHRRLNAPLQQGRAFQAALIANLWQNRNASNRL